MRSGTSPNTCSGRRPTSNNSTPPSVCGRGRGRIPMAKVVADDSEVTALATVFKDTDQNKETRSNDVDTTDIAKSGGDKSELSSPPMTRSLILTTLSTPIMMKKTMKEKKTRKPKKRRPTMKGS